MLIFLCYFCYCLLRGFSSARLCSGFPQLCWKGQHSCASKRVMQSPLPPKKESDALGKTLWLTLQGMRNGGCYQWDSGPAAH